MSLLEGIDHIGQGIYMRIDKARNIKFSDVRQ